MYQINRERIIEEVYLCKNLQLAEFIKKRWAPSQLSKNYQRLKRARY